MDVEDGGPPKATSDPYAIKGPTQVKSRPSPREDGVLGKMEVTWL